MPSPEETHARLTNNPAFATSNRTWPVRIIGLYFLGQIIVILGVALLMVNNIGIEEFDAFLESDSEELTEIPTNIFAFLVYLFYIVPITLLLLIATLGFIFLNRTGWIVAMIAQCAILIVNLVGYFWYPLPGGYLNMAGAITAVFILNMGYIQQTLRDDQMTRHLQTPMEEEA